MKKIHWTYAQRQYYRRVRRKLRCSFSLRKRILAELAQCIEEDSTLTVSALEQRFGTPEQFAQNVLAGLEPEERFPHRWVLILALVCLILLSGFAVYTFYSKKQEQAPAHYAVLVIHPEDGTSETIALP